MYKYLIYILFALLSIASKTNTFLSDDEENVHVNLSENILLNNASNSFLDHSSDDIEECEDEESLKHIIGILREIQFAKNEKKGKTTFLKTTSIFNYSLINICIDLPPPSII